MLHATISTIGSPDGLATPSLLSLWRFRLHGA